MGKRMSWKSIALIGLMVAGSANLTLAAGSPAAVCSATKHKIIGKYVAGILNCYAKAIAKEVPVDSECISKVATKAALAFTKVESGGACATTGDFATLAGRAIAFIDTIDASLPTTPFPFACYDGIKDGFETAVDCGGQDCVPCP